MRRQRHKGGKTVKKIKDITHAIGPAFWDGVPTQKVKRRMSEVINIKELNERIERESVFVDTLRAEMGKVIVGQSHLIDTLLIGLLSNGHILLEGVPGLAKTLAITTLAKAVDADFARIQFTPDLLPADLIGTLIYSQKTEEFIVRKGSRFRQLRAGG